MKGIQINRFSKVEQRLRPLQLPQTAATAQDISVHSDYKRLRAPQLPHPRATGQETPRRVPRVPTRATRETPDKCHTKQTSTRSPCRTRAHRWHFNRTLICRKVFCVHVKHNNTHPLKKFQEDRTKNKTGALSRAHTKHTQNHPPSQHPSQDSEEIFWRKIFPRRF